MFDLQANKYKTDLKPLYHQRDDLTYINSPNSVSNNQSLSANQNTLGNKPHSQIRMEPFHNPTLRMKTIQPQSERSLQMFPARDEINQQIGQAPINITTQSEPIIQPKLEVEDDYPQDYMDKLLPGPKKGKDPSRTLTNAERLIYVGGMIGKLSPHFKVESSGEVKQTGKKKESELVADSKKTASCCLHVLTRETSKNKWQIVVADHLSPHTLEVLHTVLVNSPVSPVQFGYHTKKDKKEFYDRPEIILGHELCGHAALDELKSHPEGRRAVTNVHDPTVNIENAIAGEQGVPEEKHRGLNKDGIHGGESFGKMTINHFKLNMASLAGLPQSERDKMRMLADMIRQFDLFVELRGHSDNVGSEAAKQEVSDRRAKQAFLFLRKMGVTLKAKVKITETDKIKINRFLLKGMSDKEPPAGVDPKDQDAFRRVDVFVSSFPKGMSATPHGVKKSDLDVLSKTKEFTKPDKVDELLKEGTPCEKVLLGKAYPPKK